MDTLHKILFSYFPSILETILHPNLEVSPETEPPDPVPNHSTRNSPKLKFTTSFSKLYITSYPNQINP